MGEAFKENPNKLGLHNADVVTTTSAQSGMLQVKAYLPRSLHCERR